MFAFTCPVDGAPIEPLISGQPSPWSTRATARCTDCGTELVIAVSVVIAEKHPRVTPARLGQLERARSVRNWT